MSRQLEENKSSARNITSLVGCGGTCNYTCNPSAQEATREKDLEKKDISIAAPCTPSPSSLPTLRQGLENLNSADLPA